MAQGTITIRLKVGPPPPEFWRVIGASSAELVRLKRRFPELDAPAARAPGRLLEFKAGRVRGKSPQVRIGLVATPLLRELASALAALKRGA